MFSCKTFVKNPKKIVTILTSPMKTDEVLPESKKYFRACFTQIKYYNLASLSENEIFILWNYVSIDYTNTFF